MLGKVGVIIGKFYPPHRGHQLLIETALASVGRLTIIVCGKPEHLMSGELRATWLRELYPQATVLAIDDHYPDEDSRLWAELTIGWLGQRPDVVFTSEAYGEPYARYLGCRHVSVDPARVAVPCSATAVRVDPLAMWDFLPSPVRGYLAKRVCVVGAESTGTTTLARDLAEYFGTAWVAEYGREYSEARLARGDDSPWQTPEFVAIATEQCQREDATACEANRLLICDTDAFATSIWHRRYLGKRSPEVEAIADRYRYDLYLLTGDEIPFVQDGTRDGEHIRHWMHDTFVEELTRTGRDYVLLRGSREARLARAVREIERRVLRQLR